MPQYHISEMRMHYVAKCYCINAVAEPFNATHGRIQESCMLVIKRSPTKTRNRQKSAKTAGLTCTKSMLQNFRKLDLHTYAYVCLRTHVSPLQR